VGGGIFSSNATITITNNVIRNNNANRGGGLSIASQSDFNITDNRIENNSGFDDHAGGIQLFPLPQGAAGNGTFSRNVIRGNVASRAYTYGWAGGMLIASDGNAASGKPVTLSRNVWTGNSAPSRGGALFVDDGATAVLDHELMYGNSAGVSGGAIYVDGFGLVGSTLTIVNSTIANNTSPPQEGNGVTVEAYSTVTVINSIFWGNTDDFLRDGTSTISVSYTDSQEVMPGVGNLSVDPLFANPAAGDFHLRSTAGRFDPAQSNFVVDGVHSPAIDAGDPASAFALETQPNGGRINLGFEGNTAEASRSASTTTGPGVLQFPIASFGVAEGSGNAAIPVTRTGGSDGSVSVQYAITVPGNLSFKEKATPGLDFQGALTGTLAFGPGETTKQITIPIVNDDLVEADSERFAITLQNPTGGATLGTLNTTSVTIQDNDLPQVADAAPNLQRLQAAALIFGKSDEHYRDFVTKAYQRFLSRVPDAGGLQFWTDQMKLYESSGHQQGLRQENIEAGFIDSAEYRARYGGIGEAWIRGIYNDLLGRPGEQAGIDFWMGRLAAGVPPADVALGFTGSEERLRNRVAETYQTLLERAPDGPGLEFWVSIFKQGSTTEDIISGFVGSQEYYFKANRGAGNPARWTRSAYLDVLFRPGTVAEFNFWLPFLNGG
jgi:hypothetical protein